MKAVIKIKKTLRMKRHYVHGFLLFQIHFPFFLCYGLWKPWNDFTGYCCKKLKNTINYFPNAKTIDNPFLMLYFTPVLVQVVLRKDTPSSQWR